MVLDSRRRFTGTEICRCFLVKRSFIRCSIVDDKSFIIARLILLASGVVYTWASYYLDL